MVKMNAIYLLAIAGILVAVGDLALAQWMRVEEILFLLTGLALNIVGILVYTQTLDTEYVGISTAIFLGLNILAVTLGGVILFNENLNLARILGLSVLALGVVLVEVVG